MAKHLIIAGKVQGVGYRAAFAALASALHLKGWVRNRLDGSVEALVAGEPEAIERLLIWSRQGPSSARVDQVTVDEADESLITSGRFDIRPTA